MASKRVGSTTILWLVVCCWLGLCLNYSFAEGAKVENFSSWPLDSVFLTRAGLSNPELSPLGDAASARVLATVPESLSDRVLLDAGLVQSCAVVGQSEMLYEREDYGSLVTNKDRSFFWLSGAHASTPRNVWRTVGIRRDYHFSYARDVYAANAYLSEHRWDFDFTGRALPNGGIVQVLLLESTDHLAEVEKFLSRFEVRSLLFLTPKFVAAVREAYALTTSGLDPLRFDRELSGNYYNAMIASALCRGTYLYGFAAPTEPETGTSYEVGSGAPNASSYDLELRSLSKAFDFSGASPLSVPYGSTERRFVSAVGTSSPLVNCNAECGKRRSDAMVEWAPSLRPGVVPPEEKDSVFSKILVEDEDLDLYGRHNRCALVGNGPSVRHALWGEEIDSHDLVMRFDLGFPKTEEERSAVGSRTDYALMQLRYLRRLVETGEDSPFGNATVHPYLFPFSGLKRYNESTIEKYHMVPTYSDYLGDVDRLFASHTYLRDAWPSLGFVGYAMANKRCQEIDIYGFSLGSGLMSGHNLPGETLFYKLYRASNVKRTSVWLSEREACHMDCWLSTDNVPFEEVLRPKTRQ